VPLLAGGDEPHLMLCDGCDQGYHCFCVGLDAVPLEEWHCSICEAADGSTVAGTTAHAGGRTAIEREVRVPQRSGARGGFASCKGSAGVEESGDGVKAEMTGDEALAAGLQHAENQAEFMAARQREARVRAEQSRRRRAAAAAAAAADAADDDSRASVRYPLGTSTIAAAASVISGTRGRVGERTGVYHGQMIRGGGVERGGGSIGTDGRRRQIARVHELRQLWEQYRTGQLGFSAAEATSAERERVGAAVAATRAARAWGSVGGYTTGRQSEETGRRVAVVAVMKTTREVGGGGQCLLLEPSP